MSKEVQGRKPNAFVAASGYGCLGMMVTFLVGILILTLIISDDEVEATGAVFAQVPFLSGLFMFVGTLVARLLQRGAPESADGIAVASTFSVLAPLWGILALLAVPRVTGGETAIFFVSAVGSLLIVLALVAGVHGVRRRAAGTRATTWVAGVGVALAALLLLTGVWTALR